MNLDFSNGPLVMGIVNVTPDSFSDGGDFSDPQAAIAHGRRLVAEGAVILDIGGESTRPGAAPVLPDEEQRRVLPVIEGLRECGALLSVDTRHAQTMRAAVQAGAGMINDVNALRGEGALDTASDLGVPVCLMHMRGAPQTMQNKPVYKDVVAEVYAFLEERVEHCLDAGIRKDCLIVDPGIGFGKTLGHNVDILKNLNRFNALSVPILLGASRKSFIESVHKGAKPDQRLGGSLAAVAWGYLKGCRVFRVHDVYQSVQTLRVLQALQSE